eukprot:1783907-Rhodomonas_salina.1
MAFAGMKVMQAHIVYCFMLLALIGSCSAFSSHSSGLLFHGDFRSLSRHRLDARLRTYMSSTQSKDVSRETNAQSDSSRRAFCGVAIGYLVLGGNVAAMAEGSPEAVAEGVITLKEGSKGLEGGAIYVTARLAGVIKGISTGRDLSPVASIKIPVRVREEVCEGK